MFYNCSLPGRAKMAAVFSSRLYKSPVALLTSALQNTTPEEGLPQKTRSHNNTLRKRTHKDGVYPQQTLKKKNEDTCRNLKAK
jgi:hypothetical protein